MSLKLELISFKLCPFVQRAVIVLKQKKIDFEITYIDISNPPEWFKEVSPLGQVPVLKVGDDVLFESSVIQEYVDEVTPPSLQPNDVLVKAKNRAWISFGGEILMAMHGMVTSQSQADFEQNQTLVLQKLAQLETVHTGQTFFNGSSFNMIDAAYAPMFMRIQFMQELTSIDLLSNTPKLTQWSANLLAMDCVQESVVPGLVKMYRGMIKHMDGVLAKQLT